MLSTVMREVQVILLTFSRGKSILVLNCSLDVQYNNSECCSAQFFLWVSANRLCPKYITKNFLPLDWKYVCKPLQLYKNLNNNRGSHDNVLYIVFHDLSDETSDFSNKATSNFTFLTIIEYCRKIEEKRIVSYRSSQEIWIRPTYENRFIRLKGTISS